MMPFLGQDSACEIPASMAPKSRGGSGRGKGSLTGEHGVGLEKKEQMPLVFTDDDMAAMRQVRDAFAPANQLNPGKIFPGGPAHKAGAHHAPRGMPV